MNDNFPFNHFIHFENENKNSNLEKQIAAQFTEKDYKFGKKTNEINNLEQEEYNSEELYSVTDAIKESLKQHINTQKYTAFFENTFTIQSIIGSKIQVVVTTQFIKNMIENHFFDLLNQVVNDLFGNSYEISINVLDNKPKVNNSNIYLEQIETNLAQDLAGSEKKNSVKNTTFKIESFTPTQDDLIDEVNSRYYSHMNKSFGQKIDSEKTFENFVVGQSNNMAHALALAVSKDPGKVYPQLYLYGNSGLGKTHLLHAICNKIAENMPKLRICFTSANAFMSEMIMAIQGKSDGEFRRKYTELVDVLIIDDIHELKDKNRTQTEFFHIFNELQSKGKQLIFTSDKPPKDIGVEERIKTRLSSALLIEIHQPDIETRTAILKKKAIERDIFLDDDVVNFIATYIKGNIRELEGSLVKLGAYSEIMKVDIDLEIAKQQLGLSESYDYKIITIDSIAKEVASYFKIPIGDLRSKSRLKDITYARHIAMYMSHKITKTTLEEIGDFYGKRDHTSVIHGIKKIERLIKEDSQLSKVIFEIESLL